MPVCKDAENGVQSEQKVRKNNAMLTLPIKKRWFDMIAAGEKTEEYREIKPYWTARFNAAWQGSLIGGEAERRVAFRNGYSRTAPTLIATVTLDTGPGKEEWGAEQGKEYYRLHIRIVEAMGR